MAVKHFRLGAAAVLTALATVASAAPTCTITGANGPIFGVYDVNSTLSVDAAGSINYSCTGSAKPEVRLSSGAGGSFFPRAMVGASSRLRYNLYLDAGRSQVWGEGSGGTHTYQGPAGNSRSVPVFGRIPPLQDVAPGTYSDTIVVTFVF